MLRVDKDYMESVTVTSTDPQVIEWKWRPEAVWSDGAPIGCKDMYLLWLAANTTAKDGDAQIFDSAPTGYDQISGDHLLARRQDGDHDVRQALRRLPGPVHRGRAGRQPAAARAHPGAADRDRGHHQDRPEGRHPGAARGRASSSPPAGTGSTRRWPSPAARTRSRARPATTPRCWSATSKWWANPGGPAKITITAVTDSQANVQKLLNKEVQVIAPQAESAIAEQIRAQGGEFNVFAQRRPDLRAHRLPDDQPAVRRTTRSCARPSRPA